MYCAGFSALALIAHAIANRLQTPARFDSESLSARDTQVDTNMRANDSDLNARSDGASGRLVRFFRLAQLAAILALLGLSSAQAVHTYKSESGYTYTLALGISQCVLYVRFYGLLSVSFG